jgi:hypothetical protein
MTRNSKEYMKAYYAKNKAKYNAPMFCQACECRIIKSSVYQHKRSRKHLMAAELFLFKNPGMDPGEIFVAAK